MATLRGIWKFNENIDNNIALFDRQNINFTSYIKLNKNDVLHTSFDGFTFGTTLSGTKSYIKIFYVSSSQQIPVWDTERGWLDDSTDETMIISFGETKQIVSDDFYTWFTTNAIRQDFGEETNNITVTINYNNTNLASLVDGQNAVINCAGKSMKTDIIISTDVIEPGIHPIIPIDVSTEYLMNLLIENASSTKVGNIYRYTGKTTDNYENGCLYIIEEVD